MRLPKLILIPESSLPAATSLAPSAMYFLKTCLGRLKMQGSGLVDLTRAGRVRVCTGCSDIEPLITHQIRGLSGFSLSY